MRTLGVGDRQPKPADAVAREFALELQPQGAHARAGVGREFEDRRVGPADTAVDCPARLRVVVEHGRGRESFLAEIGRDLLPRDGAIADAEARPAEKEIAVLGAAGPGDITAEGRILKRGRTIAFGEARITDAAGQLVAIGRATYMILSGR